MRATTQIHPGPLDSNNGPLHIGRDVGFTRYFGGGIDEVFVYDRTLTPSEVMMLAAGFDDDDDGLPDHFERRILENSPDHNTLADVNPGDDFEADGSTVEEEWIAGTDPLDPHDVFRIVSWEILSRGESRALLATIDGRSGRVYSLVASATLEAPWNTVASTGPLASDQPLELIWEDIPQDKFFVRARVDFTPTYPIPE